MQTLSDVALEILIWRRRDLARGAYRITEARRLSEGRAATDLYTERIDTAQFNDSLACVKAALGVIGGIWTGLEKDAGEYIEVLAIRLE